MNAFDCFPSFMITKPKKFQIYNMSLNAMREDFASHSRAMIPWIPQSDNEACKIYYMEQNKSKSITHQLRCIFSAQCEHEIKPLEWNKVFSKMSKPPEQSVRNCDQRLFFRHKNIFLTKCYFTFGFRSTEKHQVHIYQTNKNPILFYRLKSSPMNIRLKERSFKLESQKFFEKYVMLPNKMYYVPPRTNYIIVTCQKSIFAVDVMEKNVFKELRQHYTFHEIVERAYHPVPQKNKSSKRKNFNSFVYDIPPKTPAIDRMVDMYGMDEENYVPDAEAFFTKNKKSKSNRVNVDSDGFVLPFLPVSQPNYEPLPETVENVSPSLLEPVENVSPSLLETVENESPSLLETVENESPSLLETVENVLPQQTFDQFEQSHENYETPCVYYVYPTFNSVSNDTVLNSETQNMTIENQWTQQQEENTMTFQLPDSILDNPNNFPERLMSDDEILNLLAEWLPETNSQMQGNFNQSDFSTFIETAPIENEMSLDFSEDIFY